MPHERILVVEDDGAQRRLMAAILEDAGYGVLAVATAERARIEVERTPVDLVLTDWRLPGLDGMQLFLELHEQRPDVAVVIVTAFGTIAHAVEAVRAGADDYLAKPFERQQLLMAVERSLRARRLEGENRRLTESLSERERLVDLIGRSPAMQSLFDQVQRLARSTAAVLLQGEAGAGKELVARALHQLSPARQGDFHIVRCASVTALEFDQHLSSPAALLFDEVTELPPTLQAQLVEALDGTAPGGKAGIYLSTRVDVCDEGGDTGLIADLRRRLAVRRVLVPPLRDRRDDIPLLIDHFLERSTRRHGLPRPQLTSALKRRLLDHPWPGNVRELADTIDRLVTLSEGGQASVSDLPPSFEGSPRGAGEFRLPPTGISWSDLERSALRQALEHTRGNRTQAAKLLQMPYKAFLYRLEKHDLRSPTEAEP